MKRGLKIALLVIGSVLTLGRGEVFAKDVEVFMDDVKVEIPQRCIVEDGHVLVPLRAICERMGYDVSWDDNARQVRIKKDFKDIIYTIDKNGIVVNNIKKSVDVAPRIIDDRVYISEEAFNKGLTDQISWDYDSNNVSIKLDEVYTESNWLEIVELKKTYVREDENGNVRAKIDITVPQIANYENDMAYEKINNYYKDKANEIYDEYMKLMEDDLVYYIDADEIYEYGLIFEVGQNSNNVLSIVTLQYNKKKGPVKVLCDVFDTLTGEKLSMYDVFEGTKEEIDKWVVDGIKNKIKKNSDIINEAYGDSKVQFFGDINRIEFCLVNGDAVFFVNPFGTKMSFRVYLNDNKDSFKIKAGDTFNYNEELEAKKVAMDLCGEYTKFVEKTTLGTDECYVFENHNNSDGERIAVNRSGERVYKLKKKDGMYYAMSKKKVKDEVSDRDAVKLVRDRINNNEYTTEVYGNMMDNSNEQEYGIISVVNLDGTVNKKFAVSRKDGAMYIEKKVTPTLKTNDDGTISAAGFFEVDVEKTCEETDVDAWGSGFKTYGSYMQIRENGTGTYNIGVTDSFVDFKLVSEDGKTYMEITNEEETDTLPKGSRFLVEVKEIDGISYLYVHDEDGKDIKPGNKYWKLNEGDIMRFEPYGYHNKI